MSATVFVKYHGYFVRFVKRNDVSSVYELVERRMATPFVSEADAWMMARDYGLDIHETAVE